MLVVQGVVVQADALLEHPAIRQSCEAFLAESSPLPSGATVVYACQSEIVDVDLHDQPTSSGAAAAPPSAAAAPTVLCSSDATTCVIVAIVARMASGGVERSIARIAHHDEATTGSAAALHQTVAGLPSADGQRSPAAKLWLVGGQLDADGVGARVLSRLLVFLQRCEAALEVQLCCAGPWNTGGGGGPLCTSLALDLSTLRACPAAPTNAARGPLLPARGAQWCYSRLSSGGQAGTLRSLQWHPTPRPPVLRLALWQGRPPEELATHAAFLLSLDDEQLLEHWSTSPRHEPPHFAADVRASCRWVLQQVGPARLLDHVFAWQAGSWQPVSSGGGKAAGPEARAVMLAA